MLLKRTNSTDPDFQQLVHRLNQYLQKLKRYSRVCLSLHKDVKSKKAGMKALIKQPQYLNQQVF